MRRFILTGTPGAGKTAILRQLELDGFGVIEEAATDVIALEQAKGVAEPWLDPVFIDKVVNLQRARAARGQGLPEQVQFHDRSPVCTVALARFLGYPPSEHCHASFNISKRNDFTNGRSSSSNRQGL